MKNYVLTGHQHRKALCPCQLVTCYNFEHEPFRQLGRVDAAPALEGPGPQPPPRRLGQAESLCVWTQGGSRLLGERAKPSWVVLFFLLGLRVTVPLLRPQPCHQVEKRPLQFPMELCLGPPGQCRRYSRG